jgi:hypothetical protein
MRYSQSTYQIGVVNELMETIDNHNTVDSWVDQTMMVQRIRDLEFALREIKKAIAIPHNEQLCIVHNIIQNSKVDES